jgi:hypothetical protein
MRSAWLLCWWTVYAMARGRQSARPPSLHRSQILGGGLKALEQLFPGFGYELGRAGAVPINRGFDLLYEIPGHDPWPRIKFGQPVTWKHSKPISSSMRREMDP